MQGLTRWLAATYVCEFQLTLNAAFYHAICTFRRAHLGSFPGMAEDLDSEHVSNSVPLSIAGTDVRGSLPENVDGWRSRPR